MLLGPDKTQRGNFHPTVIRSIHVKKRPVKQCFAGQDATFALKKVKRSTAESLRIPVLDRYKGL